MRRTTARRTRAVPGTEGPAVAQLSGGPLPYTLRQSPRARGLRVVIHPDRGVVVTVPATRIGRTDGERRAVEFLEEREPWIRRHLARHADVRAELAARGGARDGGSIRLEGRVVPIRVVPAVVGSRRSTVARFDELVIHRAERDRRPDAAVIEAWLRDLARERIDEAVADHARALGVTPRSITIRDPRGRWGSASQKGRVSLSWRLVLAPREGTRDGRDPRARASARVRPRPVVLGPRRLPSTGSPDVAALAARPRNRAARRTRLSLDGLSSGPLASSPSATTVVPVQCSRFRSSSSWQPSAIASHSRKARSGSTSSGSATRVLRTGASSSLGSLPRIGPSSSGTRMSAEPQPCPWIAIVSTPSGWIRSTRGGSTGVSAQVLEAVPSSIAWSMPPLDLTGGDMREGRPEVDPEPGPHAGRDEDVHQGGFRRVGMMDAAQDRQHERRRIGPRGVEVEALRGRKHAIEQFAIHRPAQHPHRDAVVALAPILRLAADPPLCLGCPAVPVALHRLHARDGGVERSSTTYRRLHRRLPVNHVDTLPTAQRRIPVVEQAERGAIYRRIGVEPIINGATTMTYLGGSLMPPEVIEAMREASMRSSTSTNCRMPSVAGSPS